MDAGDRRGQVTLHYGFGVILMVAGTPRVDVFEESIVLADRDGDPELRWTAREPLWFVHAIRGELEAAAKRSA